MNKKLIIVIAGVVVLFLIACAAAAVLKKHESKISLKWHARSDYQAVFLTNGQVYFGKLSQEGRWYTLKDIYYLQVTENLQPASGSADTAAAQTAASQNPTQQFGLVKLGSEIHGPQDEMFIAPDKILFWENLKDDSKVLEKIK